MAMRRAGRFLVFVMAAGALGGAVRLAVAKDVPVRLIGQYSMTSATAVAVSGKYAFVAARAQGLVIVDVSNPDAPTLAGHYGTSGYGLDDVAVSNGYVCAVASWCDPGGLCFGGLEMIRVAEPSAPARAGQWNTGLARAVAVLGGYAYVADSMAGLQIIDVSVPTAPKGVGGYYAGRNCTAVAVSAGYAYITGEYTGLNVVRIIDPSSPQLAGSILTAGLPCGVAVADGYAYVTQGSDGLEVFDVSVPASPSREGRWDTPGHACGVAADGRYVYVADGSAGLHIVDVANPGAPTRVGGYDTPGQAVDVALSGRHVYVADGDGGLAILSLGPGADFDADGDVDLSDFTHFQVCFNGPNRPLPGPACGDADLDVDDDIDLSDFTVFQTCFNGPNRPPACE